MLDRLTKCGYWVCQCSWPVSGLGIMKEGEDKRHVIMALLAINTDELSKQFYRHRQLSKCAQQISYENFMRFNHLTTNPVIVSKKYGNDVFIFKNCLFFYDAV